jgi:hypothetical protein
VASLIKSRFQSIIFSILCWLNSIDSVSRHRNVSTRHSTINYVSENNRYVL